MVRKDIGPYQQELVAKVRLLKNWKLKSKFKFTLKNPPIEKQKELIRKHLKEIKQKTEITKNILGQEPIPEMSVEQIE